MPPKPDKGDTGPKKTPNKGFSPPVIVTFASGSTIFVLGDVNRHPDADVQVAITCTHNLTDDPFIGLRIKFRRAEDTTHLYDGEAYHTVTFKHFRDQYAVEHHKADETEKANFLRDLPNNAMGKRACDTNRLYIVKLMLDGNVGPEITGHGSSFTAANAEVNSAFNQLPYIASCRVVYVYLWEYTQLQSHLEWAIADQAARSDPLLFDYHTSSNTPKPQGYVQWGRIRPRDINMKKAFTPRNEFHDFDNFVVMYGNAEAYEAKHFFDLSKQLRDVLVKMSIFSPPGSNGDYYIGFVWIPDWETYQHIFSALDNVLITTQPHRVIKALKEKAEGEKDPVDNPLGWSARVMEKNAVLPNAPLTLLLHRPSGGHPHAKFRMPAATDLDQEMPTHNVYVKTFPSAVTVKARLKAIDKHRRPNNNTKPFDEKRRLLVGRDLSVSRCDDLLEGLPQSKMDELTANLNSSQKQCILTHCRNVANGVNIIEGPFGSGKTVLVATLCEIQSARNPGSKTFVACSSNSACDAVVPKFAKSKLMIVRAHALSLGRATLLKDYHASQRTGKLKEANPLPGGYEPPVRPQRTWSNAAINDDDLGDNEPAGEAEEWKDEPEEAKEEPEEAEMEYFQGEPVSDVEMLRATLGVIKMYERLYRDQVQLFEPTDPRMVSIDVAIHTWVLKFAGIIDSKWSTKPRQEQNEKGTPDPWAGFRELYAKSDRQRLNEKEWAQLKKDLMELAQTTLRAADVIIATAIQGETNLLKHIFFQHTIIDEISVTTHGELLCAWKGAETVTLIGDSRQLRTRVLTTPTQNPFANVQSHGPLQRWSALGMPVFRLTETMRMTVGLEDLANTIFYQSKLVAGPGTALDHPKRAMSKHLRSLLHKLLPKLTLEPEGIIYPIFFDVKGKCIKEDNGSSRVNPHNTSFIVSIIERLLANSRLLSPNDFGIATPYAAQRRVTRKALAKAGFGNVRVGTVEYWQGEEAPIMIVDIVRAGNDNGDLGFLREKERLNVVLSRQKQHLFVVGDTTCCDTGYPTVAAAETQEDEEAGPDAAPATKSHGDRSSRQNVWVIKVIKWFREHGRVSEVDMETLSDVKFPGEEDL